MTTETATRPVLDPDHAARLERLAARRNRQRSMVPGEAFPPPSAGRAPTKKRRHPAKYSRGAALALSVLASGGLGFLFATTDPGAAAAPAVPVGVVPAAAPAAPAAAAPVAAATVPVTVPADPTTVNGESFTNKWGDVQVQATFAADGTLTAVEAVQVPFRDGKSVRINNQAVPRLNSEALSAQSALVDTVSGATYTSVGYQQSLQSAIDIAVASGVAVPATA